MKKSALLAVSALSLGVVGLATFTPVVNAVTSGNDTVTVKAKVSSNLTIGGEPVTPNEEDQDFNFSALAVDFGDVAPNATATEQVKTVAINNNSGHSGALTVTGTDLTGSNNDTIPAAASVATGASGWSVKKTDGGNWLDISGGKTANVDSDTGTGSKTYSVTYGLGTDESQAAGTYNGSATYTYTINDTIAE